MQWLELSPGYACNCRCTGCFSCSTEGDVQMSWLEVTKWLQWGRRRGARHLWLSGGEPTLRKDFLKTLKLSKALGYERVKVQTNGMMFSYESFAERAVAAGMNEVNLLLKSLDSKLHDGLNRTPGSHRLLHSGLDRLTAMDAPPRLEGDILMTSRNYTELPELVEFYAGRGLVHFNLWLFSIVDQGDKDLARHVPPLGDCVKYIMQADQVAQSLGVTMCSLNTPFCLLPPERWELQFDAAGMQLAVVNPGAKAFMLETSSIEQGVHVDTCQDCAARSVCRGMRQDYLNLHGASELEAVDEATWRRHGTRGSRLDL